jgi:hypothetical protein
VRVHPLGTVVAPPQAGSARPIGVRARVATFAGSTTATKVRTRRPCELRHDVECSTIIHRADAAATAGVAYQLDAELAAEAITDHLAMMTSPGWAAQRPDSAEALRGSGQTLHLHASDEPSLGEAGEWFVERGAEGAKWQHRHGTADVTVRGPATTLLPLGREHRPPGRVSAGT